MATINKDTPCIFVTTVARNRLPVFRTDALKSVACGALDEAAVPAASLCSPTSSCPNTFMYLLAEHAKPQKRCVTSTAFSAAG
jgi:hypothetical protein